MKLPSTKKILREDVKDAPAWASTMIDLLNNFMESVYQALNKNITYSDNLAVFVKDLTYKTPTSYPLMEDVKFVNSLKTRALGVQLLQIVDRSTYQPAPGPVYVPWVEDNGVIVIKPIAGLIADTTYQIRLLVS